jgi:hypothetical protein
MYEEVIRVIDEYRLFDTNGGGITLGTAMLLSGDTEGALKEYNKRKNTNEVKLLNLLVRAYNSDNRELDKDIEKATEIYHDEMNPSVKNYYASFIIRIYAAHGDIENSFKWLEIRMKNSRKFNMGGFLNSPFLVNLHDDPRWLKFEERAGVAPHQLAEIKFNPVLPAWSKKGSKEGDSQ